MQMVDEAVDTKVTESMFQAGSNPVRFWIQSSLSSKFTSGYDVKGSYEPERHMKLIRNLVFIYRSQHTTS